MRHVRMVSTPFLWTSPAVSDWLLLSLVRRKVMRIVKMMCDGQLTVNLLSLMTTTWKDIAPFLLAGRVCTLE